MRTLIIGFSSMVLLSCGKEELLLEAPSMVGNWIHYTSNEAWEIVYIQGDGTGYVEWYTNSKLHKDTDVKTWYVKDNRLFLGKTTFNFTPYDIETYPTLSGNTFIEGFDTMSAGKQYVVMDDKYYVEKE